MAVQKSSAAAGKASPPPGGAAKQALQQQSGATPTKRAEETVVSGPIADQIKAERETVAKLQTKLTLISDKIAEKSGGREEYMKKRDELRNEIAEVNKAVGKLEDERRQLNERESKTLNANRYSRSRLENFQRTAVYRTVAGIDARLKEIDYTIMTSSISMKEQKALKSEADKLRKTRSEVAEMEKLENELLMSASMAAAEQKATAAAVVDKRNVLRDELRVLRDNRDVLRVKLQVLEQARSAALEPLRDLFDERDALRNQVAEHMNNITQLNKEQADKEIALRAEQAKKRQARIDVERFERQIKNLEQDKTSLRKAIANASTQDRDWSASKAHQMYEYLEHILKCHNKSKTAAEAAEPLSSETKATDDSPERLQLDNTTYLVKRKVNPEDEVAALPAKRKGGRSSGVSSYINHSLPALKELKSLNVSVPRTMDEVPETLRELSEIIKAAEEKLKAGDELKRKKVSELEDRLSQIVSKENELLQHAPVGWKRAAPATTTQA